MKTLSSAEDLTTIGNRLSLVGPTDARLWGSMSVHQMLCHLTDSFECPLGERVAAPLKASWLPAPVFKWFALQFPMKWPKGVPTTPETNQNIGGTPPGDFSADHTALLNKLDQFAHADCELAPHPMFGPMTRDEWMRWGYLHTDHHLRQFAR